MKAKEIRNMKPEERKKKLTELMDELMHERGVKAMGGAPTSSGRIRSLRKDIARFRTVMADNKEI
ncbi:MAG: 50S ribosomal protein L29 [Thermoplasmata archaeon]